MLETLISQLATGGSLADEQVCQSVEWLIAEQVPAGVKADFLIALAKKGETTGEIAAFARALRDKSILPLLDAETRAREILDVVGTGGDRLSTFNISTTVAIVCGGGGRAGRQARQPRQHFAHRQRGRHGSAGHAHLIWRRRRPSRSLREHGFAFFFAPKYHPAFRHIIPARKLCAERGQSTIFNFLGPLLNPARPSAMLVGVPRPDLCEPFARVLQSLGVRRAMVVCGAVPG